MTELNKDTTLIISNIVSVTPFKNGPENEWFARTESGLTYALFTPMGYKFKPGRKIHSIESTVQTKFLKGKDRKVYIATAINYEEADEVLDSKLAKFAGMDVTQLSDKDLMEFMSAKSQKINKNGPSPQKWVDALSYAASNINEDLKALREAERRGEFSSVSREVDEKYMAIMEESRDTFLSSENQLSNWMATSANVVGADNKGVKRSGYIANSSRSDTHATENIAWDMRNNKQAY